MSEREQPDRSNESSRALDAIVSEAKEHLDVPASDIDWARLESRVMAAVEKEQPAVQREAERARVTRFRRDNVLRAGAFVLAAAAAVAVFVNKDRVSSSPDQNKTASIEGASASSLRTTEGTGEIRVGNAVVATPGYVVRAGDSIDADGARAVFERTRKVTWLLEQDRPAADQESGATIARGTGPAAHTRVKAAGESLILGLENGVIEAQVVPVPTGEAFAVDIATDRGSVRVAVHGTHLRVARAGNRVVVDLTEGVVSIGVPPRTGVTYGTLVTAPAHVELDATDLATLRVDHTPAAVRAAVPLSTQEIVGSSGPQINPVPVQPALLPGLPPPAHAKPAAVALGAGAVTRPDKETAPPTPATPPKRAIILPPRDAITQGIRECAAAAKSRSGDGVRITVNSSLKLRVSSAGAVESAQFSPPLLPDIQTCAAQVIYKTKLEETGLVTIPVEFSY